MRYGVWSLLMNNHDRQRLDSSLVYTGAHNVYYVKSCLSDAKCFSGSRYSFRVQELKPLLFHNWPVHGEIAWLFPAPCKERSVCRIDTAYENTRGCCYLFNYDVTTAAYAVGYESYPISVGNIRGCLESHPREILPG